MGPVREVPIWAKVLHQQVVLFLLLFIMMLCCLICSTDGHVALTFPPARKYDLDFLDSSRTKPPCGMPKGNIKTSFLEGSKFNVSWHLGYPHKGGFKIQLLDYLERPVLDLTPTIQGSEFVSNDATAQSFQVQLPHDFTCENCTLRLLRQALEWGPNYKFWTCADVDIKQRKKFRENCSGHGRYLVGRCKCDRLYYGEVCQYRDECIENSDCGDHGTCIDIEATTAPRKQCYCQLGWFGPGCNKRSPVKTTEIDFELYKMKKLSDTFKLYWRILKEHKEIEAVMVVNGTSYVGLGWRPRSLTKSCKNFPQIGPKIDIHTAPDAKAEPNAEPEPEPKSEPEPTSEPEPNSEPEPKSEPEPTSEPEPQASGKHHEPPQAEPEPAAEPEPSTAEEAATTTQASKYRKSLYSRRSASPTPLVRTVVPDADVVETSVSFHVSKRQGRNKRDAEAKEEHLNPYTPRHDFSPMDCTDMVIGSARGTASRIADYYTRDRSTPKVDSFWGGKNDLTAAMGFEKDGITTILFRKKLAANEPADHAIEEGLMHVIFAQGQEQGHYVHVPKSGIETAQASVKDFYQPDELKYHGHQKQRGVVSMDFFEETVTEDQTVGAEGDETVNGTGTNHVKQPSMPQINDYGGIWKVPKHCNPENHTCEYSAKWELLPRKDVIRFTITTKHTDTWTGIAFSNDEKMSQTDTIIGWVDKNGRPFMMDSWINGYTQPMLDASQNIFNMSGRIVDGVTTLSFSRNRITNDPKDFDFTNDRCLFMMFPVRGGAFNSVNKKIRKHEVVPTVSTERICIRSHGEDADNEIYMTTTETPGMGYNVEVKLIELGENFVLPSKGTLQFEDLSNSISENFQPVFSKLPGYRRLVVEDIKADEHNIIAKMNLQLEKMLADNKGRSLTEKTNEMDEKVQKILQESVESGRVGNLKVDPQYLVLEPQSLTSNIIPDASSEQDGFFSLTEAKLYIVLGCIAALILVALVQASCTIYRTSGKSSANHKDHLIPNSAWKDYSANTNYAFDAFEAEEKKVQQQHQQHGINGKSSRSSDKDRTDSPPSKNQQSRHLQRPQSRPPSVPPSSHQHPGAYAAAAGDTRSLQRPRGGAGTGPYAVTNMDRATFSLPRTAYDRNHHSHRSGGGGQGHDNNGMQPDFYFMPSQRKYSGEVVRVYVDYNNQPKS